jgi:GNAT superfamily N-acetyltransferase
MAAIWALEKAEGGTSEERMVAYFDGELNPQKALAPRTIYLAEEGDVLLGYIAGHLTTRLACQGELEWLYVTPERRRSAVASGLMPSLASWFQQQKAPRVCVNVAQWNAPAINFYAIHGAEQMKPGWMVWSDFPRSILKPS